MRTRSATEAPQNTHPTLCCDLGFVCHTSSFQCSVGSFFWRPSWIWEIFRCWVRDRAFHAGLETQNCFCKFWGNRSFKGSVFLGWFRQVCSVYWTTIDTCCHVLYEIQDTHAVMRNCGSRAAGRLALVGLFVWLQHFCRHGSENISWDSQCKERSLSQAVLRERGLWTSCVMARGLLTLAGFKEAAGALQKVLAAWEGLDVPHQASWSGAAVFFASFALSGVPLYWREVCT